MSIGNESWSHLSQPLTPRAESHRGRSLPHHTDRLRELQLSRGIVLSYRTFPLVQRLTEFYLSHPHHGALQQLCNHKPPVKLTQESQGTADCGCSCQPLVSCL